LQAARELLAEKGEPKLVRLDDIAERSGRSVQTILNIWPRSAGGKSALFADLVAKASVRDPHAMSDDELLSAATSVTWVETEEDLALVLVAAERFDRRMPAVAIEMWKQASWARFVEPQRRLGFVSRALALAEATDDPDKIAVTRMHYGFRLRDCGDDQRADQVCERVYEDLRMSEDPRLIELCSWAAQEIAQQASWRGDEDLTLRWFRSAIEQARRIEDHQSVWLDAAAAARGLGLVEEARQFISDEPVGTLVWSPTRRAQRALILGEPALARFHLAFDSGARHDVEEALVIAEAEMLNGRLASAANILNRTDAFVEERTALAKSESDIRILVGFRRRLAELRGQLNAMPPSAASVPDRTVVAATAAMKRLLKAVSAGGTVAADENEDLVELAMRVIGHFAPLPKLLKDPVFL
jgi:hypothetical protein